MYQNNFFIKIKEKINKKKMKMKNKNKKLNMFHWLKCISIRCIQGTSKNKKEPNNLQTDM